MVWEQWMEAASPGIAGAMGGGSLSRHSCRAMEKEGCLWASGPPGQAGHAGSPAYSSSAKPGPHLPQFPLPARTPTSKPLALSRSQEGPPGV